MTALHIDAELSDDERRRRLFAGDLFILSPNPATTALVDWAREMLTEAFAPHDPRDAQFHMPVEGFVDVFAPVKPAFIHHPQTRKLQEEVVAAAGCDPETTYLDVPRLRGVTSDAYLTSGVGYAHHPHRDTWYSAPMAQLNWWLPIYPFDADGAMAFHPRYWTTAVSNRSDAFNYYEWNANGRKEAAKHIYGDTRVQPRPEEPVELTPDIRVVGPVAGVTLFSGAQLHSTVPNTSGRTRFSIDFRTVNVEDLRSGASAPNVDSRPQGTALRDFTRTSDRAALDEELVARYDTGGDESAASGVLVYTPGGGP